AITPASGGQNTSVPVTITGTFLTGATLNLPVGITAVSVIATTTQINALLAIDTTAVLGPQSITVTTTGGISGAVLFTVNPPPGLILASIAPSFGAQGASVAVTLTGTNLAGATLNLPLGITATAVTTSA